MSPGSARRPPTRRRCGVAALSLALALALAFSGATPCAADSIEDIRAQSALKFFRVVLNADVNLTRKALPTKQLLIVFLYVDNRQRATDLAARFLEISRDLQDVPIVTEVTADLSFAAYGKRIPAGIYIADRPDAKSLASIVDYGIEHHIVVYSPFEGHVERGVLGGLFVGARELPYVNRNTLQASQISLKPFLFTVAKVYP